MATRNDHVLGITSAWLLVPVVEAALRGDSPSALGAWTAVAAAVSLACYPALGTRLGPRALRADKACARLLFAALSCRTFATSAAATAPRAAPVVVALCYVASARQKRGTRRALVAHLLFRYLGYWWVSAELFGPPPRAKVLWHSALYWAHAGLSAATLVPTAEVRARYLCGCAEVAALGALALRG